MRLASSLRTNLPSDCTSVTLRRARLCDGCDDDALNGGGYVVRRQQRQQEVQIQRQRLAPRPAQRCQHSQRVQCAARQRHLQATRQAYVCRSCASASTPEPATCGQYRQGMQRAVRPRRLLIPIHGNLQLFFMPVQSCMPH